VQIISDAPAIPWEMICLQNGVDLTPLAQRYALTRWHPEAGAAAGTIHLDRVHLVVASAVTAMKGVQAEIAALQAALGERLVLVEPAALRPLLRVAEFDALHVIGHGYAEGANAAESFVDLGDGPPLRASDLAPYDWRARRPLLFLNACSVGSEGIGLTGLAGWAPAAVDQAGAGAFVAPLWQATDATAALFAGEFYRRLLAGETIGASASAGRLAAAVNPDPTWLCYAVYAHPHARAAISY
jgi:hypothetical protein